MVYAVLGTTTVRYSSAKPLQPHPYDTLILASRENQVCQSKELLQVFQQTEDQTGDPDAEAIRTEIGVVESVKTEEFSRALVRQMTDDQKLMNARAARITEEAIRIAASIEVCT